MTTPANKPKLVITNTFSDLVTKFNTVSIDLGATGALNTSQDSDVVGAINELEVGIRGTSNNLVATDLTTTANDLVGAINEIEGVFDASAKGISAGSSAFDITTTHASGISLAAPITSLTGHLSVADDKEIRVGTGNDLKISHDATNSIITNSTGFLDIRSDAVHIDNAANDEKMALFSGTSVDLYYSNSKKFETKSTGAGITGQLDLSSHLDMPDDAQIKLGTGDDLILQHVASGSISSIQGQAIKIRNLAGTETMASFNADGASNLFYDNSAKLATTSDGIDITGIVNLDADAVIKGGTATAITLDNANVTIAGNISVAGTVDGRDVATDGTKLDGIETNATADQTAAEIRVLVEAATNSNVFTDADHTKLDGIEASATADQTDAEIRAAVEAATNSNVFTDADHTKLNAIETSATADQTASEILAKLITVDGAGTDLDADKLDGQQGSYYATAASVGTLSSLNAAITVDRTNLVAAINELQGDITQINDNGASANNTIIGTLGDLETSTQANIVAAINEIEGVFDASTHEISAGSNAFTVTSGAFTVDASGDINLDADGGDVFLKDAGTTFGSLTNTSGNLILKSGTTTALTFSGADVVPAGTVDGRDIAADGTKLDAIEASADVTDTANVVAALTAGTNVTIAGNGTISATNTNTEYSTATNTTLGLVKIGYSENGKNYPVELSNGQMFVNVPWDTDTDTNTQNTYSTSAVSVSGGAQLRLSGSGPTAVATDNVKFASGGATTVSQTDPSTITISSINTTYTVGDGGLTQKNFTTALKSKLDGIESNLNAFVEPSQALTTTATTVADAINELKAAIPLVFNASGTQLN